jgi:hypothetical protein
MSYVWSSWTFAFYAKRCLSSMLMTNKQKLAFLESHCPPFLLSIKNQDAMRNDLPVKRWMEISRSENMTDSQHRNKIMSYCSNTCQQIECVNIDGFLV